MNTRIDPLHYKYWIGILIFIIVLIISATWLNVQNLADKISFALTISSVILALLAIYFTVNFNSLFSNNIVTFLNLNNDINDTAQKLSSATQELNNKLDNIPVSLRGLHDKIDTFTTSMIQSSPSDKLGNSPATEVIKWDENKLMSFFVELSNPAMIVLYLVTKCRWKGKHISFSDMEDKIPMISRDFMAGVTITCSSLNLFNYEITSDSIIISYCDEHLTNNIDKMLDSVMQVHSRNLKSKDIASNMKEAKEKIDVYVSS